MQVHDKKQESIWRSAVNSVQRQSSNASVFTITTNRPEAIAQRKLQDMANDSQEVKQLASYGKIASGEGTVVQRVKIGDAKELSDGWSRIIDETGDWMALIEKKKVVTLVPKSDFDSANEGPGQVNDLPGKLREMGCSLMVAADFLGISAKGLCLRIKELKNQTLDLALKKILTSNGYGSDIKLIWDALGLKHIREEERTYEELMAALKEGHGNWSGAISYNNHIVRVKGVDGEFNIWDPQLGTAIASLPLNAKFEYFEFT